MLVWTCNANSVSSQMRPNMMPLARAAAPGELAKPAGLGNTDGVGICHSYTPDGRCVSLLKLLLTNYCVYDCQYCINRISSDTPRARFTPDEVVFLTVEFYKRNYIEGLFLSSGVIQSPDYTMEQMVAVARSLRIEHRFGGYIHLKAVPGASRELMTRSRTVGRQAQRKYRNATGCDLVQLAPAKKHSEIETSMRQIANGILDAKDRTNRAGNLPISHLPARARNS